MQEHIPKPIRELANINIEMPDKEELVDVSTFSFDMTVPQEERAAYILETLKTPNAFRVGNMGVKLEFANDAPALQDIFTDFLKRKKSGL
ncbi:MAG: hypothetical protein FWG14_12400 [Peptococcaceae bacterium]|nr:hypothetical protein [Peptococcaceae bacterium]